MRGPVVVLLVAVVVAAALPTARARYRAQRRLALAAPGRSPDAGAAGAGGPALGAVGSSPDPEARGAGQPRESPDRGARGAARAVSLGVDRAGRGVIGAGLLAGVVAGLGGMRLVVIAAAGAAAGALVWRRHVASLPARRRRAQLPEALDRMAATLRGGASVPVALAAVGGRFDAPLGPELAALGTEASGGSPTVAVLDAWATAQGDRDTRLAATALVLATTVGAAPARAADGVAATLRERADLADERRALAAQARMSAVVLSVAPVGFATLLGATDAGAQAFLLGSPAGWVCLATGLTLDAAGAAWMTRLTRGQDA